MSPRPARFRMSLRVLWIGLLVLAFMIQPMLTSIGEVHELGHSTVGVGLIGQHVDDHDAEGSADAGASSESDDPVHLLWHLAHCCSQTPSALGCIHTRVPALAGSEILGGTAAELRLVTSVNDVLRPPISA